MRKFTALTLIAFYVSLGLGPLFGLHAHDQDHGRAVHAHGGIIDITADLLHPVHSHESEFGHASASHSRGLHTDSHENFARHSHDKDQPELPLGEVLDRAQPIHGSFKLIAPTDHEQTTSGDDSDYHAHPRVSPRVLFVVGRTGNLVYSAQTGTGKLIRGRCSPRSPPQSL